MQHRTALRLVLVVLLAGCTDYDPFGDAFSEPDADNDGFPDSEDCAPNDVLSNPDSVEICDGRDNDCDGEIDEDPVVGDEWYPDADGDNFGVYGEGFLACERPEAASRYPGDCDDEDALTYPDADELCDGVDNDCDDHVDEAPVDRERYYADRDGDGYGTPLDPYESCPPEGGGPPDGYSANDDDCDDSRDDISPANPEICDDDNTDEDCNGAADDRDSAVEGQTTYYYDADNDAYGDDDTTLVSCEEKPHPQVGGDCDNNDSTIFPGAPETPGDGIDSNCDGSDD